MADQFNLGLAGGDALPANSFGVTIDGQPISVKEVTGLKLELDMIEVKSQTAKGVYIYRTMPGRQKPVTITITRAMTKDMFFATWIKAIEFGVVERKDVTVDVFSPTDKMAPQKTFIIKNAQPSSVEATTAGAGSTSPLEEKVSLKGESLEIKVS